MRRNCFRAFVGLLVPQVFPAPSQLPKSQAVVENTPLALVYLPTHLDRSVRQPEPDTIDSPVSQGWSDH